MIKWHESSYYCQDYYYCRVRNNILDKLQLQANPRDAHATKRTLAVITGFGPSSNDSSRRLRAFGVVSLIPIVHDPSNMYFRPEKYAVKQ